MTDHEKLIVATLINAIHDDQKANESFRAKLGEIEAKRAEMSALRETTRSRLEAAILRAQDYIR